MAKVKIVFVANSLISVVFCAPDVVSARRSRHYMYPITSPSSVYIEKQQHVQFNKNVLTCIASTLNNLEQLYPWVSNDVFNYYLNKYNVTKSMWNFELYSILLRGKCHITTQAIQINNKAIKCFVQLLHHFLQELRVTLSADSIEHVRTKIQEAISILYSCVLRNTAHSSTDRFVTYINVRIHFVK